MTACAIFLTWSGMGRMACGIIILLCATRTRHIAGTPTGPVTPATVLGASPSVLLWGESFRKLVPGVAVSLCAGGATPQPVLRHGFLQTLRQPQAVPR